MFKKTTYFTILSTLLLLMTILIRVKGDDDDDDLLGELATDIIVGVAMSVCEQYATCQAFMFTLGIIFVFVALFGCMLGELSCEDFCTRRNARRSFTTGVGYGVGKSFLR